MRDKISVVDITADCDIGLLPVRPLRPSNWAIFLHPDTTMTNDFTTLSVKKLQKQLVQDGVILYSRDIL